MLQPAK